MARGFSAAPPTGRDFPSLPRPAWEAARAAYLARVRPLADDRARRAGRGEKHPVHDFLFEYYSFRPAHLLRWTPGADVLLEDAVPGELPWPEFVAREGGCVLPAAAFPAHRRDYLRWAVAYLDAVAGREPLFGCLGLHEWAMVYRDPNVRHPYVPLRLGRADTDAVVESQPLRCTHYDAFRFFTPAAVPRNRLALTRADAVDHDQPGCLHATMDLYRFAYKVAPFAPAEVVADAFELAAAARAIDMRASPYDLSAFGYNPIRIETKDGREEYVEHQRGLAARAAPVRARVRGVYARLLAAAPD